MEHEYKLDRSKFSSGTRSSNVTRGQGRSVIVTQDHAIFLAKIAKQGHSFKNMRGRYNGNNVAT